MDAEVFTALLRRLLPRVHKHLRQAGVGPLLYLPEWFLCLFARSLPFPTVLRVWDAFLSEGECVAGQAWELGPGASGASSALPHRHCQSWPGVWVLGCAEGDSALWLWGNGPALGHGSPV